MTVSIAQALVDARRAACALPDFPGAVPKTLDDAYSAQLAAIGLWQDAVAGWKVGRLSPDLADRYGIDRFLGPVFAASVAIHSGLGPTDFAMIAGGSAAFEAEYVVFVRHDAVGAVVADHMTTGVEVASSPVATLPALGSLASIADLGNNAGQIIGGPVPLDLLDWPAALPCETRIADAAPESRTAAALPGGPAAALVFAIAQAERLGMSLRPGQFVSTGAVTGMHAVVPGQRCVADFGLFGRIDCIVTARRTAPGEVR